MTKPGCSSRRSPGRTFIERGFATPPPLGAGVVVRRSSYPVRRSAPLTVSFQLTRRDSSRDHLVGFAPVEYLDFLKGLHEAVRPRAYLEIGLRHGDSLALAGCPALGVDPAFNLRVELGDDVQLLRETSDEFFARPKPLKPLGSQKPDLAFIDGMHLAEFALRDFIGVERLSPWTGVAIFDDILPRTVEEANRDRRTRAWTGDVYKVLGMLARNRPDLTCLRVGTQPTGLLLVIGLDPANRVLSARYDALLEAAV